MTKAIQFIFKIVIPAFIAFWCLITADRDNVNANHIKVIIGIILSVWVVGNAVWYTLKRNKS